MRIVKLLKSLSFALLLFIPFSTQAELLSSQAQLDSILGNNLLLDTFDYGLTTQVRLSGSLTSSTTVAGVNGGNSGLIEPGVTFQRNPAYTGAARPLDFNPLGYYGANVPELATAGGCCAASIRNDLQIVFTQPVNTFGVNLVGYVGFAASGVIDIYDTSGILLDSSNVTAADGYGTFFGWSGNVEIGQVDIQDVPNQNYINLANFGYGQAVPEPEMNLMIFTGLTLLALRLRAKRRSCSLNR